MRVLVVCVVHKNWAIVCVVWRREGKGQVFAVLLCAASCAALHHGGCCLLLWCLLRVV